MPCMGLHQKIVVQKKTRGKKHCRRKRVLVKESQGPDFCTVSCSTLEDEELQSVCVCVCVCVCVEGEEGVQALHRLLKWEDIIAWPLLALPAIAYDHKRKAKRNRRRKIVQNSSTDYFLWHFWLYWRLREWVSFTTWTLTREVIKHFFSCWCFSVWAESCDQGQTITCKC